MHLKKAKEKGFTQAEIDEAAWMGISFAGSPTMVFYEQDKNSDTDKPDMSPTLHRVVTAQFKVGPQPSCTTFSPIRWARWRMLRVWSP